MTPTAPRRTPQRTVAVDEELWREVMTIATKRREKVSDVIRRNLVEYRDAHKELLTDD